MSYYETLRFAQDHLRCGYCQAEPLEPCRTKTGRRAGSQHDARSRALFEFVNDEWRAGGREALDMVERLTISALGDVGVEAIAEPLRRTRRVFL